MDTCCESVSVHSTILRPLFALTCESPTIEVAEKLARDVDTYFSITCPMYLVPPWSPEQRFSDDERKARLTYLEICQQCASCSLDQRWIALSKEVRDAERRGDVQAVKRLLKKREQISQVIDKEKLQQLRNEGGDKWDISFVDLYEKFPEPIPPDSFSDDLGTVDASKISIASEAYHKNREQWQIRLGSHLGQLPMDGNKPMPGSLRFSATWGSVVRTDRTIRFDMTFEQPYAGAPALVDWLIQNGCGDLKYEFNLINIEE